MSFTEPVRWMVLRVYRHELYILGIISWLAFHSTLEKLAAQPTQAQCYRVKGAKLYIKDRGGVGSDFLPWPSSLNFDSGIHVANKNLPARTSARPSNREPWVQTDHPSFPMPYSIH